MYYIIILVYFIKKTANLGVEMVKSWVDVLKWKKQASSEGCVCIKPKYYQLYTFEKQF